MNATADDGGTALHAACAWGRHEAVAQLLKAFITMSHSVCYLDSLL